MKSLIFGLILATVLSATAEASRTPGAARAELFARLVNNSANVENVFAAVNYSNKPDDPAAQALAYLHKLAVATKTTLPKAKALEDQVLIGTHTIKFTANGQVYVNDELAGTRPSWPEIKTTIDSLLAKKPSPASLQELLVGDVAAVLFGSYMDSLSGFLPTFK